MTSGDCMHPWDFYAVARDLLPAHLAKWVNELTSACLCYGLDPLLMAAIMDRESLGGQALDKNGKGDHGHGHGLMQIDDRSHSPFISSGLWKEPAFNVLYGARLLKQNLITFGGDTWAAVAAYNCGPRNVRRALAELGPNASPEARLKACDKHTAGTNGGPGNYASDIKRRRQAFFQRIVT